MRRFLVQHELTTVGEASMHARQPPGNALPGCKLAYLVKLRPGYFLEEQPIAVERRLDDCSIKDGCSQIVTNQNRSVGFNLSQGIVKKIRLGAPSACQQPLRAE